MLDRAWVGHIYPRNRAICVTRSCYVWGEKVILHSGYFCEYLHTQNVLARDTYSVQKLLIRAFDEAMDHYES